MKNRLGCFNSTGIIAAGLTLLAVVIFTVARGGLLYNPGPLNAQPGSPLNGYGSHAATGGECGLCHAPFWSGETMADRCMACHTDVRLQLADSHSLHGVLLPRDPNMICRSCHPDHRGPDASLTVMDPASFPHDSLGYSLQGHRQMADSTPFGCTDCHTQSPAAFDQGICQTCHAQIDGVFTQAHVADFGADCLACHDGIDSYGRDFDHNRFSFPLTGLHAPVSCGLCHPNARTIQDLQSAPDDCYSCHAADDPHQGRFGLECGVCHSTNGWKPALFDHDLAYFHLEGRHVDVPCENCHVNSVYQGTPSDCYSCHRQDDAHSGRYGTDCALCHSAAGWTPATFDHNLAAFRLEGRHAGVPCESCHVNHVFRGTPSDCYSCHQQDDAHGGQFGTDCAACHTVAGWLPATFDHGAFPLTAGHANLACSSCHTGGVYRGLSTACAACHGDPSFHAGMFGTNCASCHNTSSWYADYTGSHPSIDGENGINHQGASCRQCHPSNLATATCLACHDSNNPGDGGGDDD